MDFGHLLMKPPIISEGFADDNRSNFQCGDSLLKSLLGKDSQ